ncbi:restriction endonuclease subunit S (plasmid) [Escherichia coli]|uniref:restriction endonuclease subunit S n=1 Tax=Escherichia coli TaxID=562 RepID=UPI000BEACF87|nr:restriction endonuclease subunit S [Escherichia coli]EEW0634658.1 restriction endonuclease subunit S [Escherichia coli]EFH4353025.1 restriction endonuclease subunit S [Escherichia coli]EHO3245398.1 restriction endonuclease subunit S [Escherichia coli]EIT1075853.1 restriction endonuclease subunit S [Escherichia coli]EKQ7127232.1 restriction endonuclease subunit S [Escherichia coli]
MSGLNFLNKLLDGVDVEWLSLGELGDFIRGNGLQKKDFVESGFPAIHYGQIYTRYGLSADKTFTYVLPELANKLRKAQKNDLLLATTSENDEDVVKPLAWLGDNVAISGDMMLFRHEQNVKYLAYFFQSEIFQTQKMKYITGAKVRRVSSGDLSKIKIPIPCSNNPEKSLAIQSEIVRILDKFTALTAELTAELNMRKKQYNYYRDQLLSFKEGEVEWKTLGEVAKIQRGASPRPIVNYLTEQGNGIPWIKIGDTIPGSKYIDKTLQKITAEGAQKSRILNPGDFVISNSMSFGRPYILRITGAIHDGWASISNFSEKLNADYLYHYLSSKKVKIYWESKINSGSVSNLNADIIKTLPVPLPDKQKQERISALLDKFDTLTNSITEGLPREIELRQKQYEYYRDLLFSFPKPETVSN